MKKTWIHLLIAGLVLNTGCKKNEEGQTELMSPTEIADKTSEVAQKVEATKEKAAAVIDFIKVKAEDVMGDLDQPIEAIKEKAANFDQAQLLGYLGTYKDVILEKKDQIAALTAKVKNLSVTDVMGEKGKNLKAELAQYTEQFSGLKERFSVYLDKAKAMGLDLSKFQL